MRLAISIALFALRAVCLAQTWEAGGTAGAGFAPGITASNAAGHATTGFANSPAFGAYISQEFGKRFAGEIRYTFRTGDLRLSSGSTKVVFGGQSHLIHYDLLMYGKRVRSEARPFAVVGAGARIARGIGPETVYQPLWQYAFLTKTRQAQPLVSLGAGAKWKLSPKLVLRAEVRYCLSPFPRQVIEPAGETKIGGWLHEIVPFIGIGVAF
jgi:hypothetical protein